MSLINQSKLRHTLPWVDAYTMTLDAMAEAKNNRIMRSEVDDAVKRAEREAKRLGTQEARDIAANQRMIQHRMRFSPEDHKELMRLWKGASSVLLSMDWEMTEETHFREEITGGQLRFWQGEDPLKRCCLASRAEASLIIQFLRFVEAQSATNTDPRVHVRQMLEAQGITKQNFHQHVDKLAITNPWLET